MAAWTKMNMTWPNAESPKTIFASCEMTVGTPETYGAAWVTCASQEMPATSEPRIRPSATSTLRALLPSGGRNALTALDTASMPVSDEPPLANARSSTKTMRERDQAAGGRVPGDRTARAPARDTAAGPRTPRGPGRR